MPYRRPEYQRPPQSYRKGHAHADDAALMQRIAEVVGAALGIPVKALLAKSKKEDIREARQIATVLIRRHGPHISYPRIGQFFNQHHATALNAMKQIETLLEAKDAQITDKFHKALKALKVLEDANLH